MDLRELQRQFKQVTEYKLVPGALVQTRLTREDGLFLSPEKNDHLKKMIIIGVDRTNRICYGSILINTKISPHTNLSMDFLATQYLLRRTVDYEAFLDYDSYVDCAKIFSIPFDKLMNGEYFGTLTYDDHTAIWNILETNKVLTTKEKKRFGIKRM